ncbi:MAG: sodium:proton antiporter [Aeromicrobium sp.]|uniref:cation:proton antiporter n=1 Tax=Aeromicrobium sp. TaxID=1871063 RepID=UPI002633A795|nr:sodium:proton antiporter [Aeromicrobium sp.]MDF1703652.1 sodium:proton antiporter [Aeromicrobium sp.]
MQPMELAVLGVLVVVAVCVVSPRLGVAAPLSLVAVGVGLSFVPGVPDAQIDPEIVLAGVLPPLLYASSVTMPITDFRRDLKAIGGLSVILVIVTSTVLGLLLPLVVPGIGFAEAFALGAIVSPTDAVATSIARRTGAPPRLLTVLDGESMLNDATALVLLRSAVAATGISISVLDVGVDLLLAVAVACLVGVVVAAASLLARSLVKDATVATAISFVVPFVAYAPAEHLGASGLVAVVVAGLAIGSRGYVELRPEDRVAERINWRTIAFLLEGAVFLVMGLQLRPLWDDFSGTGQSVGLMAGVAALVLAVVLVARVLFTGVLLLSLRGDRRQHEASRPRMAALRDYLTSPEAQRHSAARRQRALKAIQRREHDITFYGEQSMSARDGLVLTWAGMRGCITVVAAQTLPHDLAQRDLLVLVAFGVAGASLLVQGGTLAFVVRRLGVLDDREAARRDQLGSLVAALADVSQSRCDEAEVEGLDGRPIDPAVVQQVRRRSTPAAEWAWAGVEGAERDRLLQDFRTLQALVIEDQREALLDLRSEGRYDSVVIGELLDRLDAVQSWVR